MTHIYDKFASMQNTGVYDSKVANTFLSRNFHVINDWKWCDCGACNVEYTHQSKATRVKKQLAQERAAQRLTRFKTDEQDDIDKVMTVLHRRSLSEQRRFLNMLKALIAA